MLRTRRLLATLSACVAMATISLCVSARAEERVPGRDFRYSGQVCPGQQHSWRHHAQQQCTQQQQQQQQRQKCRKLRLWPSGLDETEDRILDQLQYTVPQPNPTSTPTYHSGTDIPSHMRVIILSHFPIIDPSHAWGQKRFRRHQCPVDNCYLTNDVSLAPIADAVMFYVLQDFESIKRTPRQRWIVKQHEPPSKAIHIVKYPYPIMNYTATYRKDSTIVLPYGYFLPHDNASLYQAISPKQNHAAGKTKSIAWFVSNCSPKNNRNGYAAELSKYIDVDIYGRCGHMNWTCEKVDKEHCWRKLESEYKFYLAFENMNCKDYITEKFYETALQYNLIPIVMGAHPEEYRKVAPLNSYIHVDDFESPKELAAFLHMLSKNDHLYNNYFKWKGSGQFIHTKFWCRLCALVNDDSRLAWYEDVNHWWRGPGICVFPSPENPYASWKLAKSPSFSNLSQKDPLLNPNYVHLSDNPSANDNVVCEHNSSLQVVPTSSYNPLFP